MNRTTWIIVAVVAVLVVAGALIYNSQNKVSVEEVTQSTNPDLTQDAVEKQPAEDTAEETTVTYTESGYSPNTITVKVGETVVFKNDSNGSFWPASDDHPTHRKYSEFDPKKGISAGGSYSFTFDRAGTWQYHDHLDSSKTGTIIVE